MKYNTLPFTDIFISELGLGTMSLSRDQKMNQAIVDLALAKGINFLDTADLYQKGEIEQILSRSLKGKRDQVILASKVGNVWNSDGKSWYWDPSPKQIRKGLEESLKRLATDRIDLYQLHGGTIEDPWDEIIQTFEELKKEGKIRAFGVSSIRPNVVRKLHTFSGLSTVMCQFSMLDRRPEEVILPTIENSPMKILARGVYAKGLLINKPLIDYLTYSTLELKALLDYLSKFGIMKETLSQAFVLANPCVVSAIIGVSTLDQIQETILGYDNLSHVTPEILEEIREKLPINYYESHR